MVIFILFLLSPFLDWAYVFSMPLRKRKNPKKKRAVSRPLKNDDRIICSKRLRFVDNHPTMIEINHYPASFSYLFDENLNGSLFEILKKHDYNFYVSERTLETCFPTSEESKLLELKPNTPLLLFKDIHKDLLENPSFLSKQLYNTQHLKFYF